MLTLAEIADAVGGRVDPAHAQIAIRGVASAGDAGPGELTFFGNRRYLDALRRSAAAAALVPKDFAEKISAIPVHVANPSLAFAAIAAKFAPPAVVFGPGVHPGAHVSPEATLGDGVSVQPGAVIEPGAQIGARTVIGANVYVGHGAVVGEDCLLYPLVAIRERCTVGHRVIIHCGAVIGSDGFGFEFTGGRHLKVPQTGIVVVEDDVEIGANSTIDRARFGRTLIGEGTKIDNLVQIAHNVVVGKHSIIVAQTGIGGSTHLGQYVTLAGQTGLAGHLQIGDRVVIGAQSGVHNNIPAGEMWFGTPAREIHEARRIVAALPRLNSIIKRLTEIEKALDAKSQDPSQD